MVFFLSLLAFYKFNSECAFSYSSSLMKFWMTRGLPSRASAISLKDFPLATLAGKLGVKKLVMMSGLPAGAPGDKTQNWFTSTVSWLDYMVESVRYQWEDVAIPWWKAFVEHCKKNGVEQIAIEEFPCFVIWKVQSTIFMEKVDFFCFRWFIYFIKSFINSHFQIGITSTRIPSQSRTASSLLSLIHI